MKIIIEEIQTPSDCPYRRKISRINSAPRCTHKSRHHTWKNADCEYAGVDLFPEECPLEDVLPPGPK